MKDLRSQLAERFGVTPTPEASQPPPEDDLLGPDAHLGTPWIATLTALSVPGLSIPPRPSFNAARHLTDRALKALKKAGRSRERRALSDARSHYLKGREKLAWSRVKAQFTERKLSERAYRSLKQGSVDPEVALKKLRKLSDEELSSAARIQKALGQSG